MEAYKTLWSQDRIPWHQKSYDKKPRIGFFLTDDILQPASGCKRAVVEAVERLKASGYDAMEIKAPNMKKVMEYYRGFILAEIDSNSLKENLSGEVVDSTLKGFMKAVTFFGLPKWLRSVLTFFEPQAYPPKSVYNKVSKLCKKGTEMR